MVNGRFDDAKTGAGSVPGKRKGGIQRMREKEI